MVPKSKPGPSRKRGEFSSESGGASQTPPPQNPGDPELPGLGDYLQRVFDDFLLRRLRELKDEDSPLTAKVGSVSGPSVEIDDRPAEILVRLAIPGATKKGLSISVADRTLTISGTLSERQRTDDGYHVHEELLGESFTKSTLLPADVDAAKAEAHLKDGVLEVLLPKRRPAKIHKVRLS